MARYKQPYTLTKRGKYYYYRTYTYNGERTTAKSTGCTTKGAAKQYCDELFLENKLLNKSMKFTEFADGFFANNAVYVKDRQKPLSKNTLLTYQSQYNSIRPDLEHIKIENVNYLFLKRYRVKLLEEYAPSSVVIKMKILKMIIDAAFRSGVITQNPFDYLEAMQNTTTERDAYTLEEIKTLYKTVPQEIKSTIIMLALTGMRESELFAFSEIMIVHGDGYDYYDLKYQVQYGELCPPKMNSVRQIPIIPELKQFFDVVHERSYLEENKQLLKQFENADERKLSVHSIRHFFITNAKSYGVPPIKVEYLAGHKLKSIESVYTNFKAGDCLEILDWQRAILQQILQS